MILIICGCYIYLSVFTKPLFLSLKWKQLDCDYDLFVLMNSVCNDFMEDFSLRNLTYSFCGVSIPSFRKGDAAGLVLR